MIEKFFHNHLDVIQVTGANLLAGAITLTDVSEFIKTLGLLTALGFGLYKWYRFKKTQDRIDEIISKDKTIPEKYKWRINK